MERKTQLYFRDDNKFQFIKRELKYSCLLEKSNGAIKRAWRHSYNGMYSFPGYKNISADTITLGFARDIFLDPHNKIPETTDTSGKPRKDSNNEAIKKWIAQIGENMRHIYRAKRQSTTMADYINFSLIGINVLLVIGWLVRFAFTRGS